MRILSLLLLPITSLCQDFLAKDLHGERIECGEQKLEISITPKRVIVKGETVNIDLKVLKQNVLIDGVGAWLGVDKNSNKHYLRGWDFKNEYGFKIEPVDNRSLPVITIHPMDFCEDEEMDELEELLDDLRKNKQEKNN